MSCADVDNPSSSSKLRAIPSLGYEAAEDVGFIRCLDHGYPTPLARWHYHDEYELHLIVATSGKAFVGDWIGQFQPGHLVLTGPRLPHNWISLDVPEGGVALRDRVIQFHHEPHRESLHQRAGAGEVLPLLERARNGIEFFGLSDRARIYFESIKSSRGLERFAVFCQFMTELSRCTDYQLLSSAQLQSCDDELSLEQINSIVNQLTESVAQAPSMSEFAAQLGMTESRFSRFFRRATGNNFIDFVNRRADQPRLPAADGVEPVHHAHLLRRGLQQRRQLQSPLPGDQRHDAERVPAPRQPPLRRLTA